jgi:hypothetical protein
VPNRSAVDFHSFFISSLERVKKQLKSLTMANGHPSWQVINSLWFLADPTKLPNPGPTVTRLEHVPGPHVYGHPVDLGNSFPAGQPCAQQAPGGGHL